MDVILLERVGKLGQMGEVVRLLSRCDADQVEAEQPSLLLDALLQGDHGWLCRLLCDVLGCRAELVQGLGHAPGLLVQLCVGKGVAVQRAGRAIWKTARGLLQQHADRRLRIRHRRWQVARVSIEPG